MNNNVNLFYKGDILQMQDKSQWEIVSCTFEKSIDEYLYEYKNIQTGVTDLNAEAILNRKAIVIKFADPIPTRSKCKIYYLEDYRKQVERNVK